MGAGDQCGELARVLAAAEAYRAAPHGERRQRAIDYLFELGDHLTRMAGSEEPASPMLDIIPYVADPAGGVHFEDRRTGDVAPSNDLLARVSVALDILIDGGMAPEPAAQLVSRQMVRARAALPSEGGDARGWRRLLWWRERLTTLRKPEAAFDQYVRCKQSLAAEPAAVQRAGALDGSLWDKRIKG